MSPFGVPNRRARRMISLLASALLLGTAMVLALAPTRAQAPASGGTDPIDPAVRALLESRVEDCTVCQRMTREVLPGQFFEDAHEFACAKCHHPHTRRSDEEWRRVCSSPDCHPRAWTRTIFHRIDAAVFADCLGCHQPHVWRVDGNDCQGCHGAFVESGATTVTPNVAGVTSFNHSLHGELSCQRCHVSEEKHAELTMRSWGQCMDCHHGSEAGVDCSACHESGPAGSFEIPVAFAFDAAEDIKSRDLPFTHTRHEQFECRQCHLSGGSRAQADCRGCHDYHHQAQADCAICHETPADGAHELSIHETRTCGGADCHNREHAFDPMPVEQRNLCVSCHADRERHETGPACVHCHLLPPEEAP